MIDKNKIENWLKAKVPYRKCPFCSSSSLSLGNEFSAVIGIKEDGSFDHWNGMPLVVFVCNNCGYVMFFDGKMLGEVSGDRVRSS